MASCCLPKLPRPSLQLSDLLKEAGEGREARYSPNSPFLSVTIRTDPQEDVEDSRPWERPGYQVKEPESPSVCVPENLLQRACELGRQLSSAI